MKESVKTLLGAMLLTALLALLPAALLIYLETSLSNEITPVTWAIVFLYFGVTFFSGFSALYREVSVENYRKWLKEQQKEKSSWGR